MGMLLRIVGAVWAVIGAANLMGMFATPGISSGVGTFGLIFNMVLFIIPGLILVAMGWKMDKSSDAPSPMTKRLQALDEALRHEHITPEEHARRKRAILDEI